GPLRAAGARAVLRDQSAPREARPVPDGEDRPRAAAAPRPRLGERGGAGGGGARGLRPDMKPVRAVVCGVAGRMGGSVLHAARAREVPIVLAPNMSVGVNALLRLVAEAARALGPAYEVEIVEMHHRAKKDAPSGTALRLAEEAADALGLGRSSIFVYERHGE